MSLLNLNESEKNRIINLYLDKKIIKENTNQTLLKSKVRIRLIFPLKSWEQLLLHFAKFFGVITGVYKSLSDAINFVNQIAQQGKKADELVVGSHGGGENLLITDKEGSYFSNDFLNDLKKIVKSDTVVFFTACYGANFLDVLKDAAEKLGVGTYGSSGVYNYVTNQSENGFYYCSASSFEKPKSRVKVKGFETAYAGTVNLFVPVSTSSSLTNEPLECTITVDSSVFGIDMVPIKTTINPIENDTYLPNEYNQSGSFIRKDDIRKKYYLPVSALISNYWSKRAPVNDDTPYTKKSKELKKSGSFMNKYISEKIESNEIKITVKSRTGEINAKYLEDFYEPLEITNDFLLEKKLCKKVSGAPVSWFDAATKAV